MLMPLEGDNAQRLHLVMVPHGASATMRRRGTELRKLQRAPSRYHWNPRSELCCGTNDDFSHSSLCASTTGVVHNLQAASSQKVGAMIGGGKPTPEVVLVPFVIFAVLLFIGAGIYMLAKETKALQLEEV